MKRVDRNDAQRILALYRAYKSGREVARRSGFSAATVYNVLERYGVTPYGPHKRVSVPAKRWGKVAWAFHNHREPITSWKEFARDNYLSIDSVNMFVMRVKKEMREVITSLPTLEGVDATLQTYEGKQYKLSQFRHFTWLIDRYMLHVCIEAVDEHGESEHFPIYDLYTFQNSLEQWYASEGRYRAETVPVIEVVKSIADLAHLPDGRGIETAHQFASGLLATVSGVHGLEQVNSQVKSRTPGKERR